MKTALVSALAAIVAGSPTPLPRSAGPVPATADSRPFLAAARVQEKVDLQKLGYVEEEFLISGTANVYDWDANGTVRAVASNAPYTTRILVRRPADPRRFSGTVVVEPLNNARAYDWAFVWDRIGRSAAQDRITGAAQRQIGHRSTCGQVPSGIATDFNRAGSITTCLMR